MDAVDHVCRNVYRTLEAKGHIRSPDVIVDRLWKCDNVQALFRKQVCGLVSTVAAQNCQTVQLHFGIVLLHFRYLIHTRHIINDSHELERLTGCAKNRAASCQDARKIFRLHLAVFTVDKSAVAVDDAVNLYFLSVILIQSLCNTANG